MAKNLKLRIRNLGIVKDVTIELSDLIFFIGKNNTNKTWTAYVLHAVASDSMIRKYLYWNLLFRKGRLPSAWKKLAGYYSRKLENYLQKLDISNLSETDIFTLSDIPFIKDLLKHYTAFVAKHIHEFISIDRQLVKELKISVIFPSKKEIGAKETEKRIIARINHYLNKDLQALFMEREKNGKIDEEQLRSYGIWKYIILTAIVKALFGRPFNLPVERNTLVTFATLISLGEGKFVNVNDLLSSFKNLTDLIGKKHRLELMDQFSKFSEQLLNFIDSVVSAQYYNYNYPIPIKLFKEFVQRLTSLSPKDKEFNRKLLEILKRIIDGEIAVNKNGIFYKTRGITLPIFVSSSMVKSLAGLYAYLGYKAEEGDLVIIDEPESNLHPEAQVKMVEFLACMANNGIRVLATTHSPYVVDHLTNLIEAKRSKKKSEEIRAKFFLKTKEAFIERNRVSAYFFSDSGEVKDVFNKKTGTIDWETFSSISDRINQIYYEI